MPSKNPLEIKEAQYDAVVCGGGIPGVCAAIAAARAGIKVALTEQRPILGGNSSSFALVPPHGAASMWHNRMAREGGLLEELLMEYAYRSPFADNRRIWDLILSEWCEREPNLDLYLNTRVDGVETRDNRIESVQITQASTEISYSLDARVFVDATGDGYVAASAGADSRIGREGKTDLGERLAPDQGDSKTLPCALYMVAQKRSRPVPFVPPAWATVHEDCSAFPHRPHSVEKFASGKSLNEDGSAIQLFWWFSLGGERNTIKDSETIYTELVQEAIGVWDHLKNRCTQETREALECYEAVWWSPFPLRRESRRVLGDYMLVEDDIFNPKLFEDRIGYGGWPVDVHPPEGIRSQEPPCDQTFVNELYSLPFRMMYSRNVDNLMLAGRCISASHVAMGSIRVMNTLGAAAEAVGIAAAICVERETIPRNVAKERMHELQQRLLKEDAHIIQLKNQDPLDLALQAQATANSALQYRSENPDGFLELAYDLAQQVPVNSGRVDTVSILVKSENAETTSLAGKVFLSKKLARFDGSEAIRSFDVAIESGEEKWIDIAVNTDIPEDQLLWVAVEKRPGIYWGYSREEAFNSRFAVQFFGERVALPSHGLARVAPRDNNWFPINHNGRLPAEVHRWIDQTIGIEYDRKVRATLCHKLSPEPEPYTARNAINGVSRAEDWPNIWISNPDEALPQSLTLSWEKPKTISEIRLTFDTDLCAPDRCYGWPREAHRFVFPVPECVKAYRVSASRGNGWEEVLRVDDNYNRRRVHTLDSAIEASQLRITVLSTHGSPSARLYEIRVY